MSVGWIPAGAAGFFTLVMLMPDSWAVADREVADAVAGSFLGRLPLDLVDALVGWEQQRPL